MEIEGPNLREVRTEQRVPVLVRMTGPLAGTRYELRGEVVRIGRAADNDVVLSGADAAVVSGHQAEIHQTPDGWLLRDLDSTNGTFLDGARVTEAALRPPATIQLGKGGPQLRFACDDSAARPGADADSTVVIGADGTGGQPSDGGLGPEHNRLLRQAVARARHARLAGAFNQTAAIMREVLQAAIHRTRRRFRRVIVLLAVALVLVSGYAGWDIHRLTVAKVAIDGRILELERRLQAARNLQQADRLASQLAQYEGQALALQSDPLYRLGGRGRPEDFVTHEIRTLLAEFGADSYSIPPDFIQAVRLFLTQYQGPDRPNMSRALNEARPEMDRIRRLLQQNNLPPDFAYMVLVESAIDPEVQSRSGCAGLWQFTATTARSYGLRVGNGIDERLSTPKETRAAARYIRDLILDFGAGSSVMLALAAYNDGPAKVKHAIRDRVVDPIKERNFWYLYRIRALPLETRDYVPKVFAAMLIGRHPDRFGF
jgi:membrane-bound lytic murein transglycosylase D